MKKRLFLALLAATTMAATAAVHHARSEGESCVTNDGRSGYMFATGLTGEYVCVPNDGQ